MYFNMSEDIKPHPHAIFVRGWKEEFPSWHCTCRSRSPLFGVAASLKRDAVPEFQASIRTQTWYAHIKINCSTFWKWVWKMRPALFHLWPLCGAFSVSALITRLDNHVIRDHNITPAQILPARLPFYICFYGSSSWSPARPAVKCTSIKCRTQDYTWRPKCCI